MEAQRVSETAAAKGPIAQNATTSKNNAMALETQSPMQFIQYELMPLCDPLNCDMPANNHINSDSSRKPVRHNKLSSRLLELLL